MSTNTVESGPPDLLRRADALRDGDVAARAEAMTIYRDHASAIDPSTDEGGRRVRWLLECRRALAPEFEGLVRLAADRAADEDTRIASHIAIAQFPARRRDFVSAEKILRRVLGVVRGSGSANEITVCMRLSAVFRAQRREFEALVMARRASRLAERLGRVGAEAAALVHLGASLIEIGEHAAFDGVAARIDALVPLLDPHEAVVIRRPLRRYRADSFVDRGRFAAATAEIEARDALPLEDWMRREIAAEDAHRRARMLLGAGRAREAIDVVEAHHAPGDERGMEWLEWTALEIRCMAGFARRDGLLEASAAFLDEMERRGVAELGTGWALRLTADVAAALRAAPEAFAAVVRAYEFVGRTMLERTVELDACLGALVELSSAVEEDRLMLAEFRLRFVREHEAMLETIAALYDRAGGPPRLSKVLAEGGALRICAWCLSVRTHDGRLLPVGHFVADAMRGCATHGICEACEKRLLDR